MSMYKKIEEALNAHTPDQYLELLHPDYEFVRHQSGASLSKDEWRQVVTGMYEAMARGELHFEDIRCIYENDDILVMHHIGRFPDGTKEAILVAHQIENGKIMRTETGATPLK